MGEPIDLLKSAVGIEHKARLRTARFFALLTVHQL